MIVIFGGIIIALVVGTVGGWYWLIPAILSLIALIFPIEGFKEPECLKTVDLLPLKLERDGYTGYYVKVKGRKCIYAYDNRKKYNLDGTAYEEHFVSGNIKIYASNDCTRPIVKEFIIRPERGFLTFAPFSTRREVVFLIPEGGVYENKSN